MTTPGLRTGYFRVLDSPECKLVGVQHQGGELDWPPGDYHVVASSLGYPWFAGTGFDASSVLHGLVGVETDTIPSWDRGASCGHNLTVFFHRENGGDVEGNADSVAYTAPSGATVFAAGSKRFVWGLADPPAASGRAQHLVDPRLQSFVHNMLDDLADTNVADLELELSDPPAASGRASVNVSVTNNGPDPADQSTLTLALPSGVAFVRVASSQARCTRAPVTCTLAPLPAGATAQMVFHLRVRGPAHPVVAATVSSRTAVDPTPQRETGQVVLAAAGAAVTVRRSRR